jgi:hypothetical protein
MRAQALPERVEVRDQALPERVEAPVGLARPITLLYAEGSPG